MFTYDVALSFAGEDRVYVERIANLLLEQGIKVFYDKFETANLWGKDLYQYLSDIYRTKAEFCVIFISKYYKEKNWTRHELRNAQNRAFIDNKEYILPIFIDDVELDGLNSTIGYIRSNEFMDFEIANLIVTKLKRENNVFLKCKNLKDLLEKAIKLIYRISNTGYNQIILNSTINSHTFGLVVVADLISGEKQRYQIVSTDGLITKTYGYGETVNVANVLNIKEYMCAVDETRSELIVPIKLRENVIGVINIESEIESYFTTQMVDKIEKVADYLGFMLSVLNFNICNYKELPYISLTVDEI